MSNFTVTPKQASDFIVRCMDNYEVPLLTSAPGMGKSDIIHAIAKKLNLFLIDERLAQKDAVELGGYPDLAGEYVKYKPLETFPTEKTKIPEGYNGWLIFCDELTQAKRDVQGAFHKISLDRMIGQEKLHPKAYVVAAGNRTQDRAGSNGLITSLQSRLIHLELGVSQKDFMEYAIPAGLDPRIVSFLHFKEELLNNFNPLHTDHTYACSRTWFKLSGLTKDLPSLSTHYMPLIVGTIGQAAGAEYRLFCEVWEGLTDVNDIIKSPTSAKLPDDNATQYALVGMLAGKADATNLNAFVDYVKRMGSELQLVFLRLTSRHFIGALKVSGFRVLMREFNEEMREYLK
ncbi:ATPase [Vibrio phage D292]